MFNLDPIFFILTILVASVLLLVPSVAWLMFRLKKQREYYEATVKEAREKADNIINEAKAKSQETLLEVDKNVSKYLSERRLEIDSVHAEFVGQLEVLRTDTRKTLSEASEKVSLFADSISKSAGDEMGRSFKEANLAIQKAVNATKEKIDGEFSKLNEKIPLIDESLREIHSLNDDAKRKLSEGSASFIKASKEISEEARNSLGHSAKEASGVMESLSESVRIHMEETRNSLDRSAKEASGIMKSLAEDARGHMKDDCAKAIEELASVRGEISRHFREALKAEMDEMRKEIESYKKDRLRVVDEHVVTLVEETASIALNTKLSKDDHRDVIHNALEEAKKRGVFERS